MSREMSYEAKMWFEKELHDYRDEILSQVSTQGTENISIEELIQAKREVDFYNHMYDTRIKRIKQYQRILVFIALTCLLLLTISCIYYMTVNNYLEFNIDIVSIIIASISIITALIISFIGVRLYWEQSHIPDKRKLIGVFMSKWMAFEDYITRSKGQGNEHVSIISVVQNHISKPDPNYPEKLCDFIRILEVRNKLVHRDIAQLSVQDINSAIVTVDKLMSYYKEVMKQ